MNLNKELKRIDNFAKAAKFRMALDKSKKNYLYLAEVFGTSEEDKPITDLKEVDAYAEAIKERLKNKLGVGHPEGSGHNHKSEVVSGVSQETSYLLPRDTPQDTDEAEQVEEEASIFVPRFPDQTAELLTQASAGCEQLGTAKLLFDNIHKRKYTGQQVIAQAGAGKTYVLGALIKNFIEHKLIPSNCYSPWPVLYVTKASVVAQTEGVLKNEFNLDTMGTVIVINIEQLRSKLVGTLIKEDIDIVNGEESEVYKWVKFYRPALVIWDESQGLARDISTQSKIALSLTEIDPHDPPLYPTYQIDASATPWSRVSEAKHFAVSSGKRISLGSIENLKVTLDRWPTIAREIAAPSDPTDHCTEAMKRFVKVFDSHIVRIKNIRPKHKSFNGVQKINFPSDEIAAEYFKAVDIYNKKVDKIKNNENLTAQQQYFAQLAEYTIFRKAAENCRRDYLADWAVQQWEAGFAPSIGFSFKQTGSSVIRILIEKYGWKREWISIIWGGATEALNNKKKLAKKLKDSEELVASLIEAGVSIEDDLGVYLDEEIEKTADQLEFEKKYNLLTQKPQDREKERLAFQRQDSRLAMFSYKSGGVGLSLHHEAKYDFARPRRGLFTPVYSEKELVQALGRLPRITSISDTEQTMCYFSGTIEEAVAKKVVQKLKCLREAIRGRESWEDLILKIDRTAVPIEKEEEQEEEIGNYHDLKEEIAA